MCHGNWLDSTSAATQSYLRKTQPISCIRLLGTVSFILNHMGKGGAGLKIATCCIAVNKAGFLISLGLNPSSLPLNIGKAVSN